MRNQSLLSRSLAIALLTALVPGQAQAIFGVCWNDWFGDKCCCPQKYCCDDYCQKPLPCPPCTDCRRLCDDYCQKPLPCPPCVECRCLCDDYCQKPLPCLGCRSIEYDVCIPYRPGYGCCGDGCGKAGCGCGDACGACADSIEND
jgi:hypothetical protein